MSEIKIGKAHWVDTGKPCIVSTTPYHRDWPDKAKALGGQYISGGRWGFPPPLRPHVVELIKAVYGVDVDNPEPTVNVKVKVGEVREAEFWGLGRCLLRRIGRDMAVRPGEDCAIIKGNFRRSGGSSRYPEIGSPMDGEVVLLVMSVPRSMAEQYVKDHPDTAQIEQEVEVEAG